MKTTRTQFAAPIALAALLSALAGLHESTARAQLMADGVVRGESDRAVELKSEDPPAEAGAMDAAAPAAIKSRVVRIAFKTTPTSDVPGTAELWFTPDRGRTWTKALDSQLEAQAVRCELPSDGLYGLYMVLHNDAGPSSDAPRPGIAPQTWVRIDATSPEVQLLGIHVDPQFQINREVQLRWRAADTALPNRPVSIHWRTEASKTYQLIAEGLPAISAYRWTVPNDISGRVEIRITARDQAGNVGQYVSDRLLITADGARLRDEAGTTAQSISSGESYARDSDPDATAQTGLSSVGEPDAGTQLVNPQSAAAARKRFELGTYHRLRGEYDLAIARIRESLKLDPNLIEAWHDLGGILLLQGRLDDADRTLKTALAKAPRHVPTLRSLSLVQVRRGDYNSARRTLDSLLEIAPDDYEALLAAGDVALFSGDREGARRAWARAASVALTDVEARRRAEKRLELYPTQREPVAAP